MQRIAIETLRDLEMKSALQNQRSCRLALLLSLAIGTSVHAQPSTKSPAKVKAAPRRNSVNADVGLAVLGLAYQRVLHPHVELQLQAQYFSPWFVTSGVGGFGGQLRSYFFLSSTAPAGPYLSPFVRAAYVRGRIGDVEGGGIAWSAGAAFGQSFVFARRVVLRGGVGLQYLAYEVGNDVAKAKIRTFYPTIDLSLGIAF